MKEEKAKRKDIIKNIAIVFLAILAALTFFSNSIMNYSLPEVATVYIQPGNITSKLRGSGVIEASDPYSVVAQESRTIRSVAVKVGDDVSKDDIIYHLEETESTELREAEAELVAMELNFMQKLFSGEIRSNVINKVDAGEFGSYDDFKNRLTTILNNETAVENQVEALQKNVEEKQRRLVSLGVESGGQVALKDELLLNVEKASAYVLTVLSNILIHYQEVALDSEASALTEARTKAILKSLYAAGEISKEQYEASFQAYDEVFFYYNDSVNKLKDAVKIAEDNLIIAIQALNEAEDSFGRVTDNRGNIVSDIEAELNFNNLVNQIDAKKEEIAKLKEKSTGAAIIAPVSGTIVSLSYVAGESTQLDNTAAVIQVAGKGFTVSFSVSNEQASRVKIGDLGEVVSGFWWYNDLAIVLTGIRPDATNPGQFKELIFSVSGTDIQAGQQLSISVGSRSAQYDLTVPNSAIREDSNSKFILIIEERKTPMSNRYYATRVDVEVLAEDDTSSAIIAPVSSYEYVITTATKPVSPGQQVRLTN